MIRRKRIASAFFLPCVFAAALSMASCARAPHLIPVRGKVVFGDQPLQGVQVQFVPDEDHGNTDGRTAIGQTDQDGAFALKTPPYGDGVTPGSYKVIILDPGSEDIPDLYSRVDGTPWGVQVKEDGMKDVLLTIRKRSTVQD